MSVDKSHIEKKLVVCVTYRIFTFFTLGIASISHRNSSSLPNGAPSNCEGTLITGGTTTTKPHTFTQRATHSKKKKTAIKSPFFGFLALISIFSTVQFFLFYCMWPQLATPNSDTKCKEKNGKLALGTIGATRKSQRSKSSSSLIFFKLKDDTSGGKNCKGIHNSSLVIPLPQPLLQKRRNCLFFCDYFCGNFSRYFFCFAFHSRHFLWEKVKCFGKTLGNMLQLLLPLLNSFL